MITVPSYKIGRRHAMRLNCTSEYIGPCGKCISCKETAKRFSLDVLDVDGPLKPSDHPSLRECLPYKPARYRHKILICDRATYDAIVDAPKHESWVFIVVQP